MSVSKPLEKHEKGRFQVINPLVWPMGNGPLTGPINRWLLRHQVQPYLKAGQARILWCSLPSAVTYLGLFGEERSVYYCGDDFGSLAGVEHELAVSMEKDLSRHCDAVFTASETLKLRFPSTKTRYLPHGVDWPLFARSKPRADDLPLGRPIAGFYGSLEQWIDQDLLIYCAKALPDWDFVLIGQPRVNISRLQSLPNIRLLGPKAHHELPSYVQHWDVSLLPFVPNGQIRACNPLKLREYLAAGRPVVSRPFPALNGYVTEVITATSPGQFVRAICQAYEQSLQDPASQTRRSVAVREESWENRAAQILGWLQADI